jgi:hypothetical protein
VRQIDRQVGDERDTRPLHDPHGGALLISGQIRSAMWEMQVLPEVIATSRERWGLIGRCTVTAHFSLII